MRGLAWMSEEWTIWQRKRCPPETNLAGDGGAEGEASGEEAR